MGQLEALAGLKSNNYHFSRPSAKKTGPPKIAEMRGKIAEMRGKIAEMHGQPPD